MLLSSLHIITCMPKRNFDFFATFLQIVASETLALGASDKNLSTVLNTQVKQQQQKKQDESKTVFPTFLRVTSIKVRNTYN